MNYRAVLAATAQTVGLFAAGFIIPLAGQLLALFAPVPLIIAYIRHGRREGFAVLAASALLSVLLGGWMAAVVFLLSFGLMGLGTAEGMRRTTKPEAIALLGGLLPVAVVGALIALYLAKIGKNPLTATEDYLRSSVAEAAKAYASAGLADMASMVTSISETFVHYLSRLMPSIVIATSVTQAAVCYGLARIFIIRKQGASQAGPQPRLSSWHAPDSWVWGLIAALALVILPHDAVRFTGYNIAILFAVVYLAQGTAIVEHFLLRARLKSFMRGMIIALILAMPSIVFVIALGVVDIWADVRKVRGPVAKA